MPDLADRLQHDPAAYTWPAWATVRMSSHMGRYRFQLRIKRKLLQAADLSGWIGTSSLRDLHALAWAVDAFDEDIARAALQKDGADA